MSVRSAFAYRAARADGAIESGTIEAVDREHAARELSRSGLFPVSLAPRRLPALDRHMTAGDVALGLRVLADLVAAGLTLSAALDTAEDVVPARWSAAIPAVRESLRRGEGIHAALEQSGLPLDAMILGMIRAGEAAGAGALAGALQRAAAFAEERAAQRHALTSALVYPVILATAGSIALGFLLVSVLPRFADLIGETGRALPPLTAGLIGVSAAIQAWLVPASVVLVTAALLGHVWYQTPRGRQRWDRAILVLPVVGPWRERRATAHAALSLSGMLESGLPLPDALRITAAGVGNAEMTRRLDRATDAIAEGTRIARAFADHRAMTMVATRLVAAGEATGRLSDMLRHAAQLEADGVKRAVERSVRVIEPGLILVFGALVALVAAGLLQAMYGVRVT